MSPKAERPDVGQRVEGQQSHDGATHISRFMQIRRVAPEDCVSARECHSLHWRCHNSSGVFGSETSVSNTWRPCQGPSAVFDSDIQVFSWHQGFVAAGMEGGCRF